MPLLRRRKQLNLSLDTAKDGASGRIFATEAAREALRVLFSLKPLKNLKVVTSVELQVMDRSPKVSPSASQRRAADKSWALTPSGQHFKGTEIHKRDRQSESQAEHLRPQDVAMI